MNQVVVVLLAVLSLAACGEGGGNPAAGVAATPAETAPARVTDAGHLAQGRKLFVQHCARCHGANGEGAFDWRRRGPDGKFPPPPLNGTGHDWHHPRAQLRDVIKTGTLARGGGMPAWGDKLSDAEIDAVIAWFQSLWPDEIYAEWTKIDARAR